MAFPKMPTCSCGQDESRKAANEPLQPTLLTRFRPFPAPPAVVLVDTAKRRFDPRPGQENDELSMLHARPSEDLRDVPPSLGCGSAALFPGRDSMCRCAPERRGLQTLGGYDSRQRGGAI